MFTVKKIDFSQIKDFIKIEVRPKSKKNSYFVNLANIAGASSQAPLSWMKGDVKNMKIEITGTPKREEAEVGINEQLIVEYYSR